MMSARRSDNIPVTHDDTPRSSRTGHGKAPPLPTDSSEEELSPHSSIFEASLASEPESEALRSPPAAGKKDSDFLIVEKRKVAPGQGLSIGGHNVLRAARDEGGGVMMNVDDGGDIRSSPGLETIIEQKSRNTLRDGDSTFEQQSSDGLSEEDEDDEEDDDDDSMLLPTDRRKMSRTQSTRSDHFYYDNENQVYDYASPGQPLYQPVSTFNGAGEINMLHKKKNARSAYDQQKTNITLWVLESPLSPSASLFGGTPPISASFFSRNFASSSPMRASFQGPTFRPPVSGYRSYGSLTNHPFHNAPLARGDGGEGSGGGDRSGRFPGTGTLTPNSIRSRMGRSRSGSIVDASGGGGGGPMSIWKLWQVCGFFCCLGRREDE